jgi:hypothetical protein
MHNIVPVSKTLILIQKKKLPEDSKDGKLEHADNMANS